jgi:parallel beta-helix repeat protein
MFRTKLARVAAAILLLSVALPAHALFRTYVASTGSDVNPCTIAAPCRLLPAALGEVDSGGEIWMLDPANYNTGKVTITKSVSILAMPGTIGSVVANGDHAIEINGNPLFAISVALRNLNVRNLSGNNNSGVRITSASRVVIEDCEIHGVDDGIYNGSNAADLVVKNTTIRDMTSNGIFVDSVAMAVIDRTTVIGKVSTIGIWVRGGSHATISNSTVAGHGSIGIWVYGSNNTTVASIADCHVTGNRDGIAVYGWTSGESSRAAITRTVINASDTRGILVNVNGGIATVDLDQSSITNTNGSGVEISGSGIAIVRTAQNNRFFQNGTHVSGGTLTPVAGM